MRRISLVARRAAGGVLYEVDSDKTRLDVGLIHDFLARCSHWAQGIPSDVLDKAIANSLCFAIFHENGQVGFGRVVTDKATFAYLADVYVLPEHRGKGLSKRLMEQITQHPDLQGLRRMLLATLDAHGLYEKFGFKALAAPERMMEIHNPDVYRASLT